MHRWRSVACVLLIICFGCARIDVKTLSPEDDNCDEGIRYYERAPFLLVYSDGKGGVKTEIHYLPDRTRLRSIHPFKFLALSKNTLTFKNGMLTTATNVADASALPVAVIKAVETVAAAAVKAAGKALTSKDSYVLPPPALYRIHIDKEKVTFIGESGKDANGIDMMIHFTLQTQEKALK